MKHWILFVILFVAAFIRLYRLDTIPPSLYWEEVALGYDAYSIARTGKDHHGNPYPVVSFLSYGDYKPSGYFYAAVPFVSSFGLNAWGVRLPSAVAGVITVGLMYLLARQFGGKRFALIASGMLAITPWHIQFSRGGWEVNLALMWIVLGVYLVFLCRKYRWILPLSVFPLAFSMYTYHAARLFVPLLMTGIGLFLCMQWVRRHELKRRIVPIVTSIVVAGLLLFPLIGNIRSDEVSSRYNQTTILNDLEPVLASNREIQAHGNSPQARILYHRYWFYLREVFGQSMTYFSPSFLFGRGDGNLRHSAGVYGLLFVVQAPLILYALLHFRTRKKMIVLCGAWVLAALVAPSIVRPSPHALRFLFAVIPYTLLAALGMELLWRRKWGRCMVGGIGVVFVYSCVVFAHWYVTIYPSKSASDWQYGYSELYQSLSKQKQPGERVYVSRYQGRPSMYYLFFTQYDPRVLQSQSAKLPKDQAELLAIDEYRFIDGVPMEKGLFATEQGAQDPKANVLDTIRRPDGSPVWVIWRRE